MRWRGLPEKEGLIGFIFKDLTVEDYLGRDEKTSHALYLCRCVCSNTSIVRRPNLIAGTTTSCGHLRQDVARENIAIINNSRKVKSPPAL